MDETFLINLLGMAYIKTNKNISKIADVQGDDCKTGCLLDYPYLKKIIS